MMKCPWMPVTVITRSGNVTRTEFAECYQGECPFYSPACRISENLSSLEWCIRVTLERKKVEAQK